MEPGRSEDRPTSSAARPLLLPLHHPFPLPPDSAASLVAAASMLPPRARLQVWFVRVCSCVLVWTCVVQLLTVGQLWRRPSAVTSPSSSAASRFWNTRWGFGDIFSRRISVNLTGAPPPFTPRAPPERIYRSAGYLKVSCNGGLNQMRAAICDMLAICRLLNLTLVVPELDKKSFWADPSDFADIFDVNHFITSLRDEVHIVKKLPKQIARRAPNNTLVMAPVSWSNEAYYLNQILPLYSKYEVIHFNKTDARLANNGLSPWFQKLRCRVNYHALKFNSEIKALGNKLVDILQKKGDFIALHLRYEMDMLAFSGCTHGCTIEEAEELKRMRYAYPWWREKEIISEERRSQGLCPLTPEETTLVLKAMGFKGDIQIYIASGEIYGSERRLETLRAAFPRLVKKETLLDPKDFWHFRNHSSQMAALDYMVAMASDVFIPTYDGNMAKVVEGHRRYLRFGKSIQLDRRKLVELIDMHENKTLSWDEFAAIVRSVHENRMGQPTQRKIIPDKPKEEDYFYSNPTECLCNAPLCNNGTSANEL